MSPSLVAAGCLALLAAGVHGIVGERVVVQRLSPEILPASRFGGPRMTMAMIHVSWHLATIAFLTVGCALLLAGAVLDGDAAEALALVAASAATGCAVLAVGLGAAYNRTPRSLLRHPAPVILSAMAALAWVGAL
jgi:hypothetical protein